LYFIEIFSFVVNFVATGGRSWSFHTLYFKVIK